MIQLCTRYNILNLKNLPWQSLLHLDGLWLWSEALHITWQSLQTSSMGAQYCHLLQVTLPHSTFFTPNPARVCAKKARETTESTSHMTFPAHAFSTKANSAAPAAAILFNRWAGTQIVTFATCESLDLASLYAAQYKAQIRSVWNRY